MLKLDSNFRRGGSLLLQAETGTDGLSAWQAAAPAGCSQQSVPVAMTHERAVPAARVVFTIKSAILVRIGRVDLLPPDCSLQYERKLRIAPRSRFPPEPKPPAAKRLRMHSFLEQCRPQSLLTDLKIQDGSW